MIRERRRFTRIPFRAPGTLETGGERWSTRVLDLSLNGALVTRPETLDPVPGTPCRLEVVLEDSSRIRMDAEVAHVEGGRVGLRRTHIDIESVTHLRRLVELNLGDPALLERELHELGE